MTVLEQMIRGGRRISAAVTLDGREDFIVAREQWGGDLRGGSIELVGNRSATYEELYRSQVWVHAVVNRYARSIARLPLKAYVDAGEENERERVREGPLAQLLRRPAPRMPAFGWKSEVVTNLMVHGNCVCVKARPAPGLPTVELLPTSFAYWDVRRERGETWYLFLGDPGKRFEFRPEEVVHFRWWAGGQGLKGESSMEALRRTLMLEDAAQRHAISSFENGARPVGAYTVEGKVDREVFERNRTQLREIYGGVDNAFRIAYLEGGAKWQSMSHTLVESEWIKLRQLTREEVAAAFNIPPPVVGILDRATFSNITEQHLMEYVDSMAPVTTLLSETLEVQLIDEEPSMRGQYVEFDFDAVLAGDPIRRITALIQAVGGPFMTRNEARARMNLPPGDEAEMDTVLTATNNMSPAGALDGAQG